MIKKIVYKKCENWGYSEASHVIRKEHYELSLLFDALRPCRYWMFIDKGDDMVIITNQWDKEEYFNEENIPKLIMTRHNYEEVMNIIEQNSHNPAMYLVLWQDNEGIVHLESKNILSEDDLLSIKLDKQAKIEIERQWEKKLKSCWLKKCYWKLIESIRPKLIKIYKELRTFLNF